MEKINFRNFRIFDIEARYKDVLVYDNDFKKGDNLTISDYLEINIHKGSENMYCDITVYIDDSTEPKTLKIYTKENKKDLKTLINEIINQS